jgi:hypothetical protein
MGADAIFNANGSVLMPQNAEATEHPPRASP